MDPVTGTAAPGHPAGSGSHERVVQVRASGMGQSATALVALIGVLVFVRFLWTKVEFSTEATGWVLLPAFAACCAMVAVAQIGCGAKVVLGRSAPTVAAFMLYFCARLVCDASSRSDVIGYTFGYAEGILFGYSAGNLVRLLLDALSRFGRPLILWCGAMLLLGMNTWMATGIEATARADGRMHQLFNLIENETYQVSGALSSVVMIVSWGTVILAVDGGVSRHRPRGRLLMLLCAIGASLIIMRLGQLLGSNSAPVFIGMASVLALATATISPAGSWIRGNFLSSVARSSLFREAGVVSLRALFVGLFLTGAIVAAVLAGEVDVSRYRLFGFDEQSIFNSSISSRLDILEQNFAIQVAYAPIFGHFFVDRATTGEGTYPHSLVAVVPHLGIMGACLFVMMGISVLTQFRCQWIVAVDSPRERRLVLLGGMVVLWAFVFMLVSTFFTNILLWFPLGLFAPGLQLAGRRSWSLREDVRTREPIH